MKILYSVQATGNGHISRAVQLLPYLQRYGLVDVFLSGANSQLQRDLPVRYGSNGLSLFYNSHGGLRYKKIAGQINPQRLWKEIRDLPVEQYDVVINDFECITSLACALKKVPSVNFGHQASFQSVKVPRPESKEMLGEFLLKNYARASRYVGLHFKPYDDFIFDPVIKKEILSANPVDNGHFTVYLSSFSDEYLLKQFEQLPDFRFEVFSKAVKTVTDWGKVKFLPVNQQLFNKSMIHSSGVITGAGFETPAEVMHLGKRLMAIPIKGQYEQYCNAAALKEMGVTVVETVDENFPSLVANWIDKSHIVSQHYTDQIPATLEYLMDTYPKQHIPEEYLLPG